MNGPSVEQIRGVICRERVYFLLKKINNNRLQRTDRALPDELDAVARVVDVDGEAQVVDQQRVLQQREGGAQQEHREHVQVDPVALAVQASAAVTEKAEHVKSRTQQIETHKRLNMIYFLCVQINRQWEVITLEL